MYILLGLHMETLLTISRNYKKKKTIFWFPKHKCAIIYIFHRFFARNVHFVPKAYVQYCSNFWAAYILYGVPGKCKISSFTPANLTVISTYLQRLVAISGCGHLPHEECPKALLAAMSPFINRILVEPQQQHQQDALMSSRKYLFN